MSLLPNSLQSIDKHVLKRKHDPLIQDDTQSIGYSSFVRYFYQPVRLTKQAGDCDVLLEGLDIWTPVGITSNNLRFMCDSVGEFPHVASADTK